MTLKSEELKSLGNKALQAKKYDKAIKYYSEAIKVCCESESEESKRKNLHVYYSNRSAAHLSKKDARKALIDGQKCIEINPDFVKGYGRIGAAFHTLKEYKESINAYKEGLDKFPQDELLKKGLAAVEKTAKAATSASASNIKNKSKNEDFCVPKPPEPKSCRYIYRPEPFMETGSPLYFSDLDKRLAQIMKNNKKNDRNKECKTAKHIVTALTQFKQVKEYICSHKCKERHGRGVILEDLICDDLFVECCVKIIQAMSKTDCRFGPCLQDIVMDWPIPVDYIHREKLLCITNNNNRTWVVLLATTLTVGITTNRIPLHLVLRMIHELQSQATDQQQYNMDWSSFSSDTQLKLLNETVCRNALAGAGVKCSRHLYRKDKKDRSPLSSKDLLTLSHPVYLLVYLFSISLRKARAFIFQAYQTIHRCYKGEFVKF